MDHPSLYDDDIVTWAETQAAALRELAARPGLSNALDWDNVIEEVESLGRSEIAGAESALSLVLVHVLKYLSAPEARSAKSWRAEVSVFHAAARRYYKPAMHQRIDWQDLWVTAKRIAEEQLHVFGDRLARGLPATLPFTPEGLTSPGFDMDRALERLATAMEMPGDRH